MEQRNLFIVELLSDFSLIKISLEFLKQNGKITQDFLEKIIKQNSDLSVTGEIIRRYGLMIDEVYFAIDPKIARCSKETNHGCCDIAEAEKLKKMLMKNRIKSNLLINGAYEGNRNPKHMKNFISAIGGVDVAQDGPVETVGVGTVGEHV